MKNVMALSLLAVLLFAGCKKKACSSLTSNGIVLDQGPVAADGCDWVIQLDNGVSYHPHALSTAFQVNNKPVKLCYTLTSDTFLCGWNVKIGVIHIEDIEGI